MRDLRLWFEELQELVEQVGRIETLQNEKEDLEKRVSYLRSVLNSRLDDIKALEAQRNELKEALKIHQERGNC